MIRFQTALRRSISLTRNRTFVGCGTAGCRRTVLHSHTSSCRETAYFRVSSFATFENKNNGPLLQKLRQLPRGSIKENIQYLLHEAPVGSVGRQTLWFYLHAINEISKNSKTLSGSDADLMEQLLERWVKEADSEENAYVTDDGYYRVIQGWGKTNHSEALLRAVEVLERMKARHLQDPKRHPAPNNFTYGAFLFVCTRSHRGDAVDHAETTVRFLEEAQDKDPSSPIFPNRSLYNNMILVHANKAGKVYGAAMAAEDWLLRMSSRSAEGKNEQPDSHSFNRVLKAWSIAPEENGADRALEILNLMLRLREESHGIVSPDKISFNTVIAAFGKRGRPDKSELVFQMALDYFNKHAFGRTVDLSDSFNAMVLSWSNSKIEGRGERVEQLMSDGFEFARQQHSNISIVPDPRCHLFVIQTYVNEGSPEKAELYLRKLIQASPHETVPPPTSLMFQKVMVALKESNIPDKADRAEKLLNLQIDLAESGRQTCVPTATNFHVCIQAWCEGKPSHHLARRALALLEKAELRKAVNGVCYEEVINALCRTENEHDSIEAVSVLKRLEDRTEMRIKANTRFIIGLYTRVISALSKNKSAESAELAWEVLRSMPPEKNKLILPTIKTYGAAIFAFSTIESPRAAQVAKEIFEEVDKLDQDPNSKVSWNVTILAAILEAFARSRDEAAAEHAKRVISRMYHYSSEGRTNLEPDSRCLNACLEAMVALKNPENISRAIELLKIVATKIEQGTLRHGPSNATLQLVAESCKSISSPNMMKTLNDIVNILQNKSQI